MPITRPGHSWHKLFVSLTRVFVSLLGAGIFNFVWLAVFITFAEKPPGGPVSWLLWCLAPPLTAIGFSCGIILFDYFVSKTRNSLLSVLPFPFIGCLIGAAAIIPIGKMFVGFGMFVFGVIAMLLREVHLSRQNSCGA